jgi:hypothetical protein
MAKKFNVTGLCIPTEHYMANVTLKMDATYKMVEDGDYFIINRPRQYGKTTTLYTMSERLIMSRKYIVFNISFEGIGDDIFKEERTFSSGFVELLGDVAFESVPELKSWLMEKSLMTNSLKELGHLITELVTKTPKKVVLLIDEVDKSSNNQLFISFLALLRNKFLERRRVATFHSVVLAGVHDVKSLKLKLRKDEEKSYNSPWNIASVFKVDLNLTISEIQSMLVDYAHEQGVLMDFQHIAELLFYYTSGHPYLTSHLCKIIAEDILPTQMTKEWTKNDVFKAFQSILVEQNNTNFDTLIKNLETHPELYQIVYSVIIEGVKLEFSSDDPIINLGILHGIFTSSPEGILMVHNRIYRERIANYMISKWKTTNLIRSENQLNVDAFDLVSQYRLPNNGLAIPKILENFQTFMRQNYSNKDRDFLERNGRIIFLAFLRPIINGAGHEFKEPQISEEKRLDVVIAFHQHQYVIEMKIWHGEVAHQNGLKQLADYLDRQGLDIGHLLIFDHSKQKNWKKDWVEVEGKRIFWVKV